MVVLSGCGGGLDNTSRPPGTVITPSGLKYQDLKVGYGTVARWGDQVTIHYSVYTVDNQKIESTRDPGGQPLTFVIGRATQIRGLEEGCISMRPGGQRRLTIPPNLAYGDEGKEPLIPGGATLIYYVDMLDVSPLVTLPSGVQYMDLVVGTGASAEKYDDVLADYTGWLSDGTQFESSHDEGKIPLSFTLGTAQVIPGLDAGILGMKAGGKRRLIIPPDQAYGELGNGSTVPAYATLTYEVEMRQIMQPVTTASGLKYHEYQVGFGSPPNVGDTVVVNYTGWLTNGMKFDSSLDEGREPFSFAIGTGQVIAGWDEGLMSMCVGGRRKLIIPPELGYGEQGSGDRIPPNSTLVFQVEMLDIQPAQ